MNNSLRSMRAALTSTCCVTELARGVRQALPRGIVSLDLGGVRPITGEGVRTPTHSFLNGALLLSAFRRATCLTLRGRRHSTVTVSRTPESRRTRFNIFLPACARAGTAGPSAEQTVNTASDSQSLEALAAARRKLHGGADRLTGLSARTSTWGQSLPILG